MPRVGFERTIPAFERAKTVHALDRAAIVTSAIHFRTAKQQETTNFNELNEDLSFYFPLDFCEKWS
jgi:hypothetical protein